MTKTELKEIAKKEMLHSIGIAYYRISDGYDYSEEEKEEIIKYTNQFGTRMAKALGAEFITY